MSLRDPTTAKPTPLNQKYWIDLFRSHSGQIRPALDAGVEGRIRSAFLVWFGKDHYVWT